MHAFLPSSATWLLTLDETITFLSLYPRGYRYIDRNSFETIVVPLFSIRGYCYRNVNNRSLFGFFFFYSWNKRIVCYRNEGIEIHCSKLNNFECLRNNCSLFFYSWLLVSFTDHFFFPTYLSRSQVIINSSKQSYSFWAFSYSWNKWLLL